MWTSYLLAMTLSELCSYKSIYFWTLYLFYVVFVALNLMINYISLYTKQSY